MSEILTAPDLETTLPHRVYEVMEEDFTRTRIEANNVCQAIRHYTNTIGRAWSRVYPEDNSFYGKLTFEDYKRIQRSVDGWEKTMRAQMLSGFVNPAIKPLANG